MGENDFTVVEQKQSLFTVKNVLRFLSLLCIIFVFCPSFLVSCSGQNINVSVMTAVGGLSSYGETVVDPHPIMLICLVLPVVMLVILFLKKIVENKAALITLACAAVDSIIWLIFRSSVKKIAEENYCEFKTTAVFFFNIVSLLLIVILSALVIMKKMQLNRDLISTFSGAGAQNTLHQMTNAMNQMSSAVSQMAGNVVSNMGGKSSKETVIGYCSKCGSGIPYDCKFCTSCGTPVPESMLAEAEAARKAAQEEAARKAAQEEAARKAAQEEAARKAAQEEAARKEAEEKARIAEEEARKNAELQRQAYEANQNTQTIAQGKTQFCWQCGAKLTEGSVFCQSCGAKVNK